MAAEAGLRPSGLVEMDVKKPIVGSGSGVIVEEIEFKLVEVMEWVTEKEKLRWGDRIRPRVVPLAARGEPQRVADWFWGRWALTGVVVEVGASSPKELPVAGSASGPCCAGSIAGSGAGLVVGKNRIQVGGGGLGVD